LAGEGRGEGFVEPLKLEGLIRDERGVRFARESDD